MDKDDDIIKSIQIREILVAKPEFKEAILSTRKKWGINESNSHKEENIKNLPVGNLLQLPEVNGPGVESTYSNKTKHHKDIVALMKKFKLDKDYWLYSLWHYLVYDNFGFGYSQSESFPALEIKEDPETGAWKAKIVCSSGTTLADVKEAWRVIEGLRGIVLPKRKEFKIWKNLSRDKKIYSLYERGESIAEINNILNEEDGIDLDYGNIKKIISTFRKRLKNEPPRSKLRGIRC